MKAGYCKTILHIALLLTLVWLAGCMKESELHRSFHGFTPVDIGDGWAISTPSAQGVDSLELYHIYQDIYANDKAWTLRSVSVFRNGKLIAESYLKSDADRVRQRAVWSCTKQVLGIVTGIAVQEGYIHSVNDSIKDYLQPELLHHPDKANITIGNLLNMRSGLEYKVGRRGDPLLNRLPDNSVEFALGLPLKWQPGTFFDYNSAPPQLISAIIQKKTGMSLARYSDSRFLSRIGVTNYHWEDYPDGVTLGAYGLEMPPRELAKVAQCVCDSGMVNGERIIPREWFPQMLSWAAGNNGFGYYWWVNTYRHTLTMQGRGGQFAIIYPDIRLMIVITSVEDISDLKRMSGNDVVGYSDRIRSIAQ